MLGISTGWTWLLGQVSYGFRELSSSVLLKAQADRNVVGCNGLIWSVALATFFLYYLRAADLFPQSFRRIPYRTITLRQVGFTAS